MEKNILRLLLNNKYVIVVVVEGGQPLLSVIFREKNIFFHNLRQQQT